MKNNPTKQHWEDIYKMKDTTSEVSWYQDDPRTSVELISSIGVGKNGYIIDIGGGDSKLADKLIEFGFKNLSVLDISAESLKKAKSRLGGKADSITWIESDVLEFETGTRFDVWHDRAAFHFLTRKEDITSYVDIAAKFIKPNGYLIVSTFSIHGPKKCSGLDITQYSENSINETFSKGFNHVKSFEEVHTTPFNTKQNFIWSVFQRSK